MIKAYILIQTEVGKAGQARGQMGGIHGVVSADDVTGPYDIIVLAEGRNVNEIAKLASDKLSAIEGVMRTLTCPIVAL